MTDRPHELLVHTTAPLVRNEALYRSLASAYFEFVSKDEAAPEDESSQQSFVAAQDMAASTAEILTQQPQHDTLQAFMSPGGAESWTPDSQFEISQKRTYLTRSRLATSSAAPPTTASPASLLPTSQASFMSTFTSTLDGPLDGMMSPRFRMPAAMAGPAYLWNTQSSGQPESTGFRGMTQATPRTASQGETSKSFMPSPVTVADSMTQGYNPVPAWSTSQVVMESFLSHFQTQSSHSTSSPSVRRSQRSNGTTGSLASSATRGGQMPADSQKSTSNQSETMRSSIESSLLDSGRQAPQVSPPKPRRQRAASPANAKPTASTAPNAHPAGGQASHPQESSAPLATDPVSPAPSPTDEQSAITHTSSATICALNAAASVPQQHAARPTPQPLPNRAMAAIPATPTPPDTPSRKFRKRRASNTPLQDSTSRPLKKPATHASRLEEIVSVVPRTPVLTTGNSKKAAPQVPFTGSFNVPASHQLSRVRNASFDDNISRIFDTPPNGAISNKPPAPKSTHETSKPRLPLNTSISVVPDTPTPAPNPSFAPTPAQPPQSSGFPLPSAPPSSALTTKPSAKVKRSSTAPLTSYSIHPPPPAVSTGPLTPFITPFLHKIANQMSYSRYDPTIVTRPLRKDERGYWTISLPDDIGGWNKEVREETWGYLEKIVRRGRAGWGVRAFRAGWEGRSKGKGQPASNDNAKEASDESGWRGEEWRVYCWGEVVAEVYLLLFLASSRRVRGLGAKWMDADGIAVVTMSGERRTKTAQ